MGEHMVYQLLYFHACSCGWVSPVVVVVVEVFATLVFQTPEASVSVSQRFEVIVASLWLAVKRRFVLVPIVVSR